MVVLTASGRMSMPSCSSLPQKSHILIFHILRLLRGWRQSLCAFGFGQIQSHKLSVSAAIHSNPHDKTDVTNKAKTIQQTTTTATATRRLSGSSGILYLAGSQHSPVAERSIEISVFSGESSQNFLDSVFRQGRTCMALICGSRNAMAAWWWRRGGWGQDNETTGRCFLCRKRYWSSIL